MIRSDMVPSRAQGRVTFGRVTIMADWVYGLRETTYRGRLGKRQKFKIPNGPVNIKLWRGDELVISGRGYWDGIFFEGNVHGEIHWDGKVFYHQ